MNKKYGIVVLFIIIASCVLHAGDVADTVKQLRITNGIIVLINASDTAYDEAAASKCTVHGLDTDSKRIADLRKKFMASGQYGRISVNGFNGRTLPYINNLVNLVMIEGSDVPKSEAMRVLAPRGVALVGGKQTVKPVPDDIDEWNQFLHAADNNGVSIDKVGPPERLQWTGGTRWGRSHMSWVTVTSILTSNGRLFTIEDLETPEYHRLPAKFYLIARDAFNGCELWRKPLKSWYETTSYVKFVPTQIQRRLAAIGDKVYCTLGYKGPIAVYDAATGEELRTFDGTANTVEFLYDGGVIYAIIGKPYGGKNYRGGEITLKVLDAKSGAVKWTKKIGEYVGGSLAVRETVIAYCTNNKVICCDTDTGKVRWSADSPGLDTKPAPRAKGSKGRRAGPAGGQDNINPILVLSSDMVYCSTVNAVKAYDLKDGKLAWTGKNTQDYMKGSSLFVADGLVWTGLMNGHDPRTGKIKRTLKQAMTGPMGHDRCYRNRITETYFINSKSGGTDFIPLKGRGEFPSPWVRATCGLGHLPANGMLYSSPYSCSCMQGSMLTGFNALYSEGRVKGEVMKIESIPRLIKGPAFGKATQVSALPGRSRDGTARAGSPQPSEDWPVYRNDNARSGWTKTSIAGSLKPAWTAKLPALPTASIVVGDLVYVAVRDNHTLYALSRKTGKIEWTYTAGGRIDSPPAFCKGFLIFGSRDGWVHSLRASDGILAWKFCDLPRQRLMCADGQLESVWPVNGSVMVQNLPAPERDSRGQAGDLVYFAAGRSSFLDGGLVVYALDPLTGKVVHRRQVNGPYAQNGFPQVGKRNTRLEGFKGGVFSYEDGLLYIRQQAFKPDLTPVPLSRLTKTHLIAAGGFLDDTPQHRTYWTIDKDLCYGPNSGTPGPGPQGDILVMDGDIYYEIRGYLPGRHSNLLFPQKGFTLYCGEKAKPGAGVWSADGRQRTVPRFGSWKKRWSTQIPLTGNALAVAGNTIIAAGVPLGSNFTMPQLSDSLAGKQGGLLWTASAKDGAKIAELKLPAQPVWDGISVAHGQCFVALRDGTVMCLGE